MSEVFLASTPVGETVVVKVLSDRHARDPVYQELLRNEAILGRALAHPNVVSVRDAGDIQSEPYIVLEYVDGVDLWRLQRALQHTQRRMEAPLACHVVREVLAGISHIHALQSADGHGLIHRDVSPSNIFLSLAGDVKVGDLGIATPTRAPAATATLPGGARAPSPYINRGKLSYMAPEQLLGIAVDHRVDLFAAGVVLAEVLTGRALFPPGSDMGTVLASRDAQVEALIDVLADHPPSLVSVVLRALARSPAERFQTAEEFRAALGPHAGDPSEARPLLAALVAWARTAGRPLVRPEEAPPDATPTHEQQPRPRTSTPGSGAFKASRDPETTREVPLVYYEVFSEAGSSRGRVTWARLLEMAFSGALSQSDRVVGPDGLSRRPAEMPDLAQHLIDRSATTSEVAGIVADWADALPGCTFLHAMARLVFSEESGMLVAEAAPARKEVYLFKGRPTHLASNLAGDMLGEYLVQQNALTRGELEMALAVMPRFEGRLGRVLVHLGLMDENRLAQLSDRLTREKLLELFRWKRGTLRFFRSVTPPATSMALTVDPYEVLRQGAQQLEDPAEHFAPHLERRLGVATPARGLSRAGIGPLGHELLTHTDGRTTVRTITQRVSNERKVPLADVYRELYFLLEVGSLELR